MNKRRLLVQLPPGILRRVREELNSPESGFENFNDLVVEALGQYLAGLENDERQSQPTVWSPSQEHMTFSLGLTSLQNPFGGVAERPAPRNVGDLIATDDPEIDALVEAQVELGELSAALATGGSDEVGPQGLQRISAWTQVEPVSCSPLPRDGVIGGAEERKPLFGFHNRDFPSLWALGLLARSTPEGPVPWSEFAGGLEVLARQLGGLLRMLDQSIDASLKPPAGMHFATSFPDPDKPPRPGGGQWLLSAEGKKRARLYPFVKNNVARIQKAGRAGSTPQATGPLADWGAIAFLPEGKDYRVGLTEQGLALLEATQGASIDLPHPPQAARGFLEYLRRNDPEDWEGFRRVLEAVAERPDRESLVATNRQFFNSFREGEVPPEDLRFARTMTQGYVSRGREWGLIEPGLVPADGQRGVLYELTELGESLMSDFDGA